MCIVLREENVAGEKGERARKGERENIPGEYLDHILDLLVQLKNGYVNGVRVRLGRVHVSTTTYFRFFEVIRYHQRFLPTVIVINCSNCSILHVWNTSISHLPTISISMFPLWKKHRYGRSMKRVEIHTVTTLAIIGRPITRFTYFSQGKFG